jgi:hypothetical protein
VWFAVSPPGTTMRHPSVSIHEPQTRETHQKPICEPDREGYAEISCNTRYPVLLSLDPRGWSARKISVRRESFYFANGIEDHVRGNKSELEADVKHKDTS